MPPIPGKIYPVSLTLANLLNLEIIKSPKMPQKNIIKPTTIELIIIKLNTNDKYIVVTIVKHNPPINPSKDLLGLILGIILIVLLHKILPKKYPPISPDLTTNNMKNNKRIPIGGNNNDDTALACLYI